jgi:hypothetical protein
MFKSWRKNPTFQIGWNVRSWADMRNWEPITLKWRPFFMVIGRTFEIAPWYSPRDLQFNSTFSWFLRWPLGFGLRLKKLALFVGFTPIKEGGYRFTVSKDWGLPSRTDLVTSLASHSDPTHVNKGDMRDRRAMQGHPKVAGFRNSTIERFAQRTQHAAQRGG